MTGNERCKGCGRAGGRADGRKAQMSFLSKPVMLVMTIAVLIILLQTVWSSPAREKEQELTVQLMTQASGILDIMLSSEDCLAMRTNITESAYAYVVSREKLDEFAGTYAAKEPACARNFEYGYKVMVEEHCLDDADECLSWEFGSDAFSPGSDLIGKQTRSLPVGIMHSRKDVRVGRATITITDGALERISGFLDKSCMLGKGGAKERSAKVAFSYPLRLSGDRACLGDVCRQLDCPVQEKKIPAGSHTLRSLYADGKLEVSG